MIDGRTSTSFSGVPVRGWRRRAALGSVCLPSPGRRHLGVCNLRGHPLNGELTVLGARFTGEVPITLEYRMAALPTHPPRPGVMHDPSDGASLSGERWTIATTGLGRLLAQLPVPMALGRSASTTATSSAATAVRVLALGELPVIVIWVSLLS